MIAYLKGSIEVKAIDYIVIDVNGIGYKVFMAKTDIEKLANIGTKIKVYTYLRVREDDVSLFGFSSTEQLSMFELIISVGGIGAKSAIAILADIAPSEFALAVISNNINVLKKLPGIGPKTAQRIILELKDKIKTEDAIDADNSASMQEKIQNEADAEDLIQALQVLGYRRYEINTILPKLKSDGLEGKIKEALQYLNK